METGEAVGVLGNRDTCFFTHFFDKFRGISPGAGAHKTILTSWHIDCHERIRGRKRRRPMRIGAVELLVIFAVALLVIGPDKLPAFARKLGEVLGQFKGYSDKVAKEIRETVVEPMEEVTQPIREAMKPIEEVDKTIRSSVRDVEKSFSGIGKPTKKPVSQPAAPAEAEEAPSAEEAPAPRPADPEEEEILRELKEIQVEEDRMKEEEK